jgi:hypothetical protein
MLLTVASDGLNIEMIFETQRHQRVFRNSGCRFCGPNTHKTLRAAVSGSCPLIIQKQTFIGAIGMSACANKRHTPGHSITSSARASNVGGMVRPGAKPDLGKSPAGTVTIAVFGRRRLETGFDRDRAGRASRVKPFLRTFHRAFF